MAREDKLKPANSQLKDLKSKLEAHIPDDQENKFLDIQFEVPFEPLRDYMRVRENTTYELSPDGLKLSKMV